MKYPWGDKYNSIRVTDKLIPQRQRPDFCGVRWMYATATWTLRLYWHYFLLWYTSWIFFFHFLLRILLHCLFDDDADDCSGALRLLFYLKKNRVCYRKCLYSSHLWDIAHCLSWWIKFKENQTMTMFNVCVIMQIRIRSLQGKQKIRQ